LELILNKKRTRHMPESSVPEERVVAIRVKRNRTIRAGLSWSPEVADFYMDLYPNMMEYGFSFQELELLSQGVFWE